MEPGEEITFDLRKKLIYIRDLGAGGTGSTYLFKDLTSSMLYAIKKYDPKGGNNVVECYGRFVDEIKILLSLLHPNIVRVFNYYLYPTELAGYLQMEYIDGVAIDQFHVTPNTKSWNDIFSDTVSAFEAMELNGVLHRDIRPNNVLIDNDGAVKVIDFGFGKHIVAESSLDKNSVFLNLPASYPDEMIFDGIYNHRTEIYFLGRLFEELTKDDEAFDYFSVIERMIEKDPLKRMGSFTEVREALTSSLLDDITFDESQKKFYQTFANTLVKNIASFSFRAKPISDPDVVRQNLGELLNKTSLEETLQDNSLLINCFVGKGFSYWGHEIPVSLIKDFYLFLCSLPKSRQKRVLQNLGTRFRGIEVKYDEDIPF